MVVAGILNIDLHLDIVSQIATSYLELTAIHKFLLNRNLETRNNRCFGHIALNIPEVKIYKIY